VLHPAGSRAGLPQHALAPASDRQVPGLLEAPDAPTPAEDRPTLIALADSSLAVTAAQRAQLTYLVRCALPAGVALYAEQDGTRFTFPGELGLAPRWVDEAMTPREERWVSACLLAHLNAVGASVRISLRATPPPVPALTVTADEAQHFTMFEGGFFGNLFAPEPVAYTCQGTRLPAQAHDPLWQQRLCTQATGEVSAAGMPITACRLLLTGPCEDPASLTVQGTVYTEVIFTYLRPSTPPLALSTSAPAPFGAPGWQPYKPLP
jgi:hypothetical protein